MKHNQSSKREILQAAILGDKAAFRRAIDRLKATLKPLRSICIISQSGIHQVEGDSYTTDELKELIRDRQKDSRLCYHLLDMDGANDPAALGIDDPGAVTNGVRNITGMHII